ncbi:GNAT family N-acetyltransferase [Oryzobacter terrae]|uniref:GNAT family N-acetyltransferase n=1 Tax=Oryzobacter terrae TaxID=1620385 RepID=UPI00366EF6B8
MTTTTAPAARNGSLTASGLALLPLRPGDTATVHEVFAQLSPRSAWLRFHTGLPRLTPGMARHLAAVVPGRHEAVVAVLDGRPVGLGRWVTDPSCSGAVEVAVEVADAAQGRGIGGRLLAAVSDAARRAGARELVAHVHGDNALVAAWLRRLGARPPSGPDEPFRLSLVPPVVSDPCGCMSPCWSGCSDPSGSRSTPGPPSPGGPVRATSWRCSWRAAVARCRPRSSSTSCGATTPAG